MITAERLGETITTIVVTTLLVYFLWNWLMPTLFHLPEVTLAQAFGLKVLSAVLFKKLSPLNKTD